MDCELQEYTIKIYEAYSSWEIKDRFNNKIELNIHPYKDKLFNGDKFYYSNHKIVVSYSIVKNEVIPGILIINSNKTYGRNAKGKLLYKFIPNNKTFPHFLLQYEFKNIGLGKSTPNLYVLAQFTSWDNNHPNGIISQLIGNVDTPEHFYEYQVYSKQLYSPIQKLNKEILNITQCSNFNYDNSLNNISQKYNIVNYRTPQEYYIFTIDNIHTTHYDDAISIIKNKHSTNSFIITIYITNTSLWLDYYKLWEYLHGNFKRVINIYLPHKKINMIPPIFIDTFLNLKENTKRLVIAFDITITEGHIINICPSNCIININKNYIYNETQLISNKNYQLLISVLKSMDNVKNIKSITCENIDSRQIIEYLMVTVNNYCARQLFTQLNTSTTIQPKGIFKIYTPNTQFLNNIDNHSILKIHKKVNSYFVEANYCFLNKIADPYLNITNPMRKLTDIINLCIFQHTHMHISFTDYFQTFYSFWTNNLDFINSYVKQSNAIQNKCKLLHKFIQNPDYIYNGTIIDICHVDEHGNNKYIVYFENINLISKFITTNIYNIGYIGTFKICVFINHVNMKKKIRILHT